VVAHLDHDDPGVLLADLDLAAPAKARAAIPNLINARAFAAPQALA
jgi:predicted amidohydrolase